jgi:hypothetical protein
MWLHTLGIFRQRCSEARRQRGCGSARMKSVKWQFLTKMKVLDITYRFGRLGGSLGSGLFGIGSSSGFGGRSGLSSTDSRRQHRSAGSSRGAGARRHINSLGLLLDRLSSTSLTRDRDIVSVHVEREVLQRMGVADGLVRVFASEVKALLVSVGVMKDGSLADLVSVEQAVNQV